MPAKAEIRPRHNHQSHPHPGRSNHTGQFKHACWRPPPAAHTVLTGDHTEMENELRAQLELEKKSHASTRGEKEHRERRISELEDELQRLKALPQPTEPKRRRVGLVTVYE